jgi:hypothetical protein
MTWLQNNVATNLDYDKMELWGPEINTLESSIQRAIVKKVWDEGI